MGKKSSRVAPRIEPGMHQDLKDTAKLVRKRKPNDLARVYIEEGLARDARKLAKARAKRDEEKSGQTGTEASQ